MHAATTEVAALFEQNETVRKNAAIRLLAAQHAATYLTLMERHLDHGIKVAESDLIARFEADLQALGSKSRTDDSNAAGILARWAAQGWLYRLPDTSGPTVRTICHLTPEALAVLKFSRSQRREDTIATGGSMVSIASALRQVAAKVNNDPDQIRADIEARIQQLYDELDQLDRGERPEPDIIDVEDEASAVALQMEHVIANIGQYGVIANRITRQLIDPNESDRGYRDRQQQMFDDHDAMFSSREFASYTAFTRMVQDPEKRVRLATDIAAVTAHLPGLNPELRQVLSRFFDLVQQQTSEVGRIQQRCAQRIKRFVASGTLEQHRGLARQLNRATDAANALLRTSLADSAIAMPLPLAPAAVTSIGVLDFTIIDPAPPEPAAAAEPELDDWALAELAGQVDAPKLAGLVNNAVKTLGEVSLPMVISMLDEPHLGDIVVLWSWALSQPSGESGNTTSTTGTEVVRFQSREGDIPERSVRIPALIFSHPVPLELEAAI
jgi:hypothetical protein